jgi:hypothetical protein
LIASFHLIEYRKLAVSPPKRLTSKVAGLRFWRPLNIGGDFAWLREHPGRRGLYPKLKPDFRRWAFYAAWDDEAALDEFLASSELGHRWAESTAQTCHFWLRPIRVRGDWEGMQVLQGAETVAAADRPVAHVVRLDLTLRGALAMWGWAAPNLLHHLPDSDQLLLGIPLVDRPYLQPVSFSVWRTPQTAAAFAYRGDAHREAIGRVGRSQHSLMARHSVGRFEPYRCEGTWNGRSPLGLVSSAPALAAQPGAPTGPSAGS